MDYKATGMVSVSRNGYGEKHCGARGEWRPWTEDMISNSFDPLNSLSLERGRLRGFVDDGLKLLTDLCGHGGEQLLQLVDLAFQRDAQLFSGGLQLGLEDISLGHQLLAQNLNLGLKGGRDIDHLLVGAVTGLIDVGLNVLPGCIQVLGGSGLEFFSIGSHSAGGEKGERDRETFRFEMNTDQVMRPVRPCCTYLRICSVSLSKRFFSLVA